MSSHCEENSPDHASISLEQRIESFEAQDLFEVDPSLELYMTQIRESLRDITSSPLGLRLIKAVLQCLELYPSMINQGLLEKGCSPPENAIEILQQHSVYKILLYKGSKTTFTIPKPINRNYTYSWSQEGVSEFLFTFNQGYLRLPYITKKVTISQATREILISSIQSH